VVRDLGLGMAEATGVLDMARQVGGVGVAPHACRACAAGQGAGRGLMGTETHVGTQKSCCRFAWMRGRTHISVSTEAAAVARTGA